MSIMRTCGELRNEIRAIHPSVLEDSSEDEDGEWRARRCGLQYATIVCSAHRQAQHKGCRQKTIRLDNARMQRSVPPLLHGLLQMIISRLWPWRLRRRREISYPTTNELWLNETAAAARTAQGMAFPAVERLHLGMLGQLQDAREQGGEEAVEREIKRLMGESSERETPSKATEAMNIDQTETQMQAQAQAQAQVHAPTNNSTANTRPQRPLERKRSLAPLKLDLWNSDEDD